MPKEQPIEIFMPPNVLKAKVGRVGGGIDMAAMKRAEAAMEALKVEFADWLAADVEKLSNCRDAYAAVANADTRDNLFRAAHDLKGQAETFGYPLIARMAASLAKLIDETNKSNSIPVVLVDAHVTAIRVAFRDKVKSTSDKVASVLATELEARVKEALAA
ncbi:MAG: Hpt domain-containing protein [Alphaproteobacteria bacterium]|nr:Hpt domain-containing protein [Alphaproteobacteria bacterium]MBV9541348.1 Hpt domain-containing protein [Alphaproteobacteria bacterium]MBV9904463.1 Hpt domain-containing protein [Alphaproteobacteria bacterium]